MSDMIPPKLNESGKQETAYGQPRGRLFAWGKESNAHGTMYHSPIWLPEGDKPEMGEWIRLPWMDEPGISKVEQELAQFDPED
jgi:hypothetical protein